MPFMLQSMSHRFDIAGKDLRSELCVYKCFVAFLFVLLSGKE